MHICADPCVPVCTSVSMPRSGSKTTGRICGKRKGLSGPSWTVWGWSLHSPRNVGCRKCVLAAQLRLNSWDVNSLQRFEPCLTPMEEMAGELRHATVVYSTLAKPVQGTEFILWLPSHHPSGCCTLVVVEERPPHECKALWVYGNTQ